MRQAHRRSAIALLFGFVFGAGAHAETWHAERITTGGGPVRVEQLWSKGPALRAEVVVSGHPIITLVKGDRYFIVDGLAGKGISIQRSPQAIANDAKTTRPFGNERTVLTGQGGEKVASTDANCDLYRLSDTSGRREVCVSKDDQALPVFSRVWDRQSGFEAETRYTAWLKAMDISDNFFTPDPRWSIESLTYDDYVARSRQQAVGPAPAFYPELLHGR
jgi:hypothetical protein